MDIESYEFTDPCLGEACFYKNGEFIELNLIEGNAANIKRQDAIAIAKAFSLTAEDLEEK